MTGNMVWLSTLLVACLACLGPHQALGEEENLALHFTSSYGIEVKMPYFEDFHQTDEDLREVVSTEVTKIVAYLNTTLGDMLVGRHAGRLSRVHSLWVTGTLAKKGYHFINERKRLKKASGSSAEYNNVMRPLFQRLLENSERIERELKARKAPRDPVWLEKRKTKLFGTLIEALNHPDNKVSIYFDWLGTTLTDPEVGPKPKPLEEELTEVVGHLRYEGFGHVMGSIESMVNLFFKYSGKGWH